jgi:hypothetical protein
MIRITFSLRQLLALTAFVAVTLGVVVWLSRMSGIDPESEQVFVLGSEQMVQWSDAAWVPGLSGVSMPAQQLTPQHGWAGNGSEDIRKSLISISYKDYYGNPAYRATVRIDGLHSADWAEYVLRPELLGGGNVDGATRGRAFWYAADRILEIELTQYINRAKIAKTTRLSFRLKEDGQISIVEGR